MKDRGKTMVKKVYICDEDCDECPFGNVNCSDAKKKTVQVHVEEG